MATDDDGSCNVASGCETCNADGGVDANDDDGDGVCNADEIAGCDEADAFNYDATATDNDGSCYPVILGCTNLMLITSLLVMYILKQIPMMVHVHILVSTLGVLMEDL